MSDEIENTRRVRLTQLIRTGEQAVERANARIASGRAHADLAECRDSLNRTIAVARAAASIRSVMYNIGEMEFDINRVDFYICERA